MEKLISYVDFGDFVKCCNCGQLMLLPIGAEICPRCHTEGYLSWVDYENQEIGSEDLKGKYNVVDEDEPEPEEYLTEETLKDVYPEKFKEENGDDEDYEEEEDT